MKWMSVYPVLFILAANVVGDVSLQANPRRETPYNQESANSYQDHSQQSIVPSQLIAPTPLSKEASNSAQEETNKASSGWSVGDKIAVVVAFVSLLQFFALIGTYYIMQDTGQRQLRAYIGVTEGDRDIIYDMNGSYIYPGVLLHVVNYGKITADNVRFFYRTVCLPENLGDNFDFYEGLSESGGDLSIFPSQDNVLLCRPKGVDAFTAEQMKEIFAPMGYIPYKRLFVYGHITYNDGFTDRETEFCYVIWWRNPGAPNSGEKPGFYNYKTHNKAT